jgi:hypothetical protein
MRKAPTGPLPPQLLRCVATCRATFAPVETWKSVLNTTVGRGHHWLPLKLRRELDLRRAGVGGGGGKYMLGVGPDAGL